MRPPYEGVRQLWTYNRPTYVAAFLCAALVAALALLLPLPPALRIPGLAAAALVILGEVGSLVVAHIVYDRSGLYRWEWLRGWHPGPAARIVVVHAGIDDASAGLQRVYPDASLVVLDIFDPATMTEPGIRVARREGRPGGAIPCHPAQLPLPD
ncbi:MAG TPA: hypothetical protein VFH47_03200, partial [Candidatus Thermoplasmatota archaeon]|nr:hypothetical protein [Candidatus Thermoplasmatota archaeon]